MSEILYSKTSPFEIEVPYKLIESGEPGKKPLIVYLHGFNQNIESFQSQVSDLLDLEAYHLFLQGPYPIYDRRRKKKVDEWGRAWYLYDGDQDQFIQSLEKASAFIENILEEVRRHLNLSRLAMLGYSMGGYLAGYYMLSRPDQLKEVVIIGGRLKTEIIDNDDDRYQHLKILALHGSKDKSVQSKSQKKSCARLSQRGAEVTFKEIEAKHKLTADYLQEAKQWLKESGYRED